MENPQHYPSRSSSRLTKSWFQSPQSQSRQSLLNTFLGSSLQTPTLAMSSRMYATCNKTVFTSAALGLIRSCPIASHSQAWQLHMHFVASVNSLATVFLYRLILPNDEVTAQWHATRAEHETSATTKKAWKTLHITSQQIPQDSQRLVIHASWFQPAESQRQSLLSTFLGYSLRTSTRSMLCRMHATSSKTVCTSG